MNYDAMAFNDTTVGKIVMDKMNTRSDTKSNSYADAEERLRDHLENSVIPRSEILENLHLFITPQQLRRILFLYEIYKDILTVPGVIMQFGVRWGRELALFESLRTTFEPFNHSRKVIGFDTFSGYQGIDKKDGNHSVIVEGNLTTSAKYEDILDDLLSTREQMDPLPHIQKYDLIKGNAEETLEKYLIDNPHTIISLAHLDMNLYKPTKACLELLKPHMPRGSIIIIDEVNLDIMPGETLAIKEVFGLENIKLKRHPSVNPTWPAYFVVE